jgi:hypothetical protein
LRNGCRRQFPATSEIESDKCMPHGAAMVFDPLPAPQRIKDTATLEKILG